jgi:hypothetical protein
MRLFISPHQQPIQPLLIDEPGLRKIISRASFLLIRQ